MLTRGSGPACATLKIEIKRLGKVLNRPQPGATAPALGGPVLAVALPGSRFGAVGAPATEFSRESARLLSSLRRVVRSKVRDFPVRAVPRPRHHFLRISSRRFWSTRHGWSVTRFG